MIDEFILILFPTVFTVIFVLIARLASFLKHFADETRCICREMDHADSYEDYRKWRGELRCHYLTLIPFVNKKNAMRVYRRIFHKGDHAKKKERRDSLVPLLLPSVLGVCVCMICVCSMTWAWYSASVQAPAQKITAACYEVNVVSVKNENGEELEPKGSGYELVQGTLYMVTLRAEGTVRECGGYCLIETETGETKLYTQTFKPNEEITVALKPEATSTYTFTGVWGSLPSSAENNYLPDIIPTMQSGMNMPNMSPNTDDTIPASSDNVVGSSGIEPGETSKTPSQDYAIPETTVPEETTSSVTDAPNEPVSESIAVDSTETDSSSTQNLLDNPEPDALDKSEVQTEVPTDSTGETEQLSQ